MALWTDDGSCLARHVAEAEEIVVPDHFHLEATAAIRRLEFRDEVSNDAVREEFEQLLTLRVRRVDTVPLLREAWIMRQNVTMADALYVVLARRLHVALVTGDARLARAPRLGVEILTAPSEPSR